ncbi:MAG: carboxypeptidase regulatory-like domain-containing protein [Acidobacteria bacterium]|nr:carboxypeptidase regulatory-like domain-containing protein [Acidobacteriota bacterium]
MAFRSVLWLPVALLLSTGSALAQTTGATLQGTISDEQGGVLPGAAITIANTETGWTREVVSDVRGWYRAAALPPGPYEMRVTMAGFVNLVRDGIVLTLGQEATINHGLKLATLSETVTVSADAPLVETTSSELTHTITRTELDTLPLTGRNFSNLAAMSPGVAMVGNTNNNVLASGQTNRSNSFLIDGTSNDDTTVATQRGGFSLEAVREFAVITNQFNAEYGMASGAIVSVITRSGTNDLQGRVFAFHRDDSFDAQDPFSKAQGSGKAPFSQQRYGGFLGGPLVRDRFHYFGSYEGLRERSTRVVTSVLVPPDQREEPATDDGQQYFMKTDYRLSAGTSMSARYRADSRSNTGSGIGGLNTRERGSNSSTLDQDVVSSVTSVLSSNALNEVRVQYARRSSFTNTEGYSVDGMPQINRPSGNFGKAQNLPQGRDENRLQIVDNFSYTRGSHDLKFGGGAQRLRPLRRSELPEHPAQRRVGQGCRGDCHHQPGIPGPVLARGDCQFATKQSCHHAESQNARDAHGDPWGEARDRVRPRAIGGRRVCARLQPICVARPELSRSGDGGASESGPGPGDRVRRLWTLLVLGAARRVGGTAREWSVVERVVHVVEDVARCRGLPIHGAGHA